MTKNVYRIPCKIFANTELYHRLLKVYNRSKKTCKITELSKFSLTLCTLVEELSNVVIFYVLKMS